MNIIRGCMTGLTGIKLFFSGHCHTGNTPENLFLQKDNMPDDERHAGYGGGSFPLRALILLLLTSAFISGFLAGVLAMLWFVIDCM
ncbi:hypothetical protein [Salmonella enterica]|uniref:hypothetical protein n=1 Tax=Salmonella enterica TaxID=28901 RepID=UPI001C451548|nr:hypothetical protein [Salmonella enterica]